MPKGRPGKTEASSSKAWGRRGGVWGPRTQKNMAYVRLVTKGKGAPCQMWSTAEKEQLLHGLKTFPHQDWENLCKAVPTRTKEEIQKYVHQLKGDKGNFRKKACDNVQLPWAPIESWLDMSTEMVHYEQQDLSAILSRVFSTIGHFSTFSEPVSDSQAVDYGKLYRYIAAIMDDKLSMPELTSLESAVIADLMQGMGDQLRESDSSLQRKVMCWKYKMLNCKFDFDDVCTSLDRLRKALTNDFSDLQKESTRSVSGLPSFTLSGPEATAPVVPPYLSLVATASGAASSQSTGQMEVSAEAQPNAEAPAASASSSSHVASTANSNSDSAAAAGSSDTAKPKRRRGKQRMYERRRAIQKPKLYSMNPFCVPIRLLRLKPLLPSDPYRQRLAASGVGRPASVTPAAAALVARRVERGQPTRDWDEGWNYVRKATGHFNPRLHTAKKKSTVKQVASSTMEAMKAILVHRKSATASAGPSSTPVLSEHEQASLLSIAKTVSQSGTAAGRAFRYTKLANGKVALIPLSTGEGKSAGQNTQSDPAKSLADKVIPGKDGHWFCSRRPAFPTFQSPLRAPVAGRSVSVGTEDSENVNDQTVAQSSDSEPSSEAPREQSPGKSPQGQRSSLKRQPAVANKKQKRSSRLSNSKKHVGQAGLSDGPVPSETEADSGDLGSPESRRSAAGKESRKDATSQTQAGSTSQEQGKTAQSKVSPRKRSATASASSTSPKKKAATASASTSTSVTYPKKKAATASASTSTSVASPKKKATTASASTSTSVASPKKKAATASASTSTSVIYPKEKVATASASTSTSVTYPKEKATTVSASTSTTSPKKKAATASASTSTSVMYPKEKAPTASASTSTSVTSTQEKAATASASTSTFVTSPKKKAATASASTSTSVTSTQEKAATDSASTSSSVASPKKKAAIASASTSTSVTSTKEKAATASASTFTSVASPQKKAATASASTSTSVAYPKEKAPTASASTSTSVASPKEKAPTASASTSTSVASMRKRADTASISTSTALSSDSESGSQKRSIRQAKAAKTKSYLTKRAAAASTSASNSVCSNDEPSRKQRRMSSGHEIEPGASVLTNGSDGQLQPAQVDTHSQVNGGRASNARVENNCQKNGKRADQVSPQQPTSQTDGAPLCPPARQRATTLRLLKKKIMETSAEKQKDSAESAKSSSSEAKSKKVVKQTAAGKKRATKRKYNKRSQPQRSPAEPAKKAKSVSQPGTGSQPVSKKRAEPVTKQAEQVSDISRLVEWIPVGSNIRKKSYFVDRTQNPSSKPQAPVEVIVTPSTVSDSSGEKLTYTVQSKSNDSLGPVVKKVTPLPSGKTGAPQVKTSLSATDLRKKTVEAVKSSSSSTTADLGKNPVEPVKSSSSSTTVDLGKNPVEPVKSSSSSTTADLRNISVEPVKSSLSSTTIDLSKTPVEPVKSSSSTTSDLGKNSVKVVKVVKSSLSSTTTGLSITSVEPVKSSSSTTSDLGKNSVQVVEPPKQVAQSTCGEGQTVAQTSSSKVVSQNRGRQIGGMKTYGRWYSSPEKWSGNVESRGANNLHSSTNQQEIVSSKSIPNSVHSSDESSRLSQSTSSSKSAQSSSHSDKSTMNVEAGTCGLGHADGPKTPQASGMESRTPNSTYIGLKTYSRAQKSANVGTKAHQPTSVPPKVLSQKAPQLSGGLQKPTQVPKASPRLQQPAQSVPERPQAASVDLQTSQSTNSAQKTLQIADESNASPGIRQQQDAVTNANPPFQESPALTKTPRSSFKTILAQVASPHTSKSSSLCEKDGTTQSHNTTSLLSDSDSSQERPAGVSESLTSPICTTQKLRLTKSFLAKRDKTAEKPQTLQKMQNSSAGGKGGKRSGWGGSTKAESRPLSGAGDRRGGWISPFLKEGVDISGMQVEVVTMDDAKERMQKADKTWEMTAKARKKKINPAHKQSVTMIVNSEEFSLFTI